ncbi:MAG: exosortase C-terminal domain/associated protein EpsI [Steroidobacteraceae bacterium]
MTLAPAWALAVAAAAAAVLATWPSFLSLVDFWFGIRDYEYGLPIAVIAGAWLVTAARKGVAAPLDPSRSGALMLAACLAAWLVAWNSNSQIVHQLLVPWIIGLAIAAVAGWRTAAKAVAPVAFLYFSIPVWDYAVPVLQRMSVSVTEAALSVMGIPAVVREYQVTIPEGTFRIVEGCSGKRYFMVTLAVACLAIAVHRLQWLHAAAFLALAGLLALVANWLRIVVVIAAGHWSDMQHYLVAVEHETFGNAVFILLLVAVFVLVRYFPQARVAEAAPATHTTGSNKRTGNLGLRVAAPFLWLALTVTLVQFRSAGDWPQPALGPLPLAVGTWQGPLPGDVEWKPAFIGAADEARAAYRRSDGGVVEVYVNQYGEQRQGSELVQYGNLLLAPADWSRKWPLESLALRGVATADLIAFEAESPAGDAWMVAYTYQVGRWRTTRDAFAQFGYGLQSTVRPVPSGMVILASPCRPNCEAVRALVSTFWNDMSTSMLGMLARTLPVQPGGQP